VQLEYSDRTAQWLADVTGEPKNFALVYSFLAGEILSNAAHPIGRLVKDFEEIIRKHFGGAGKRNAERAQAQAQSAARSMKDGCDRLFKIMLDFLPPLQAEPGVHFARQALEAVVFDRCGETLSGLLSRAHGAENTTCSETVDQLQELLPRHLEHLGVPKRLWLADGNGKAEDEHQELGGVPYAGAIEVMQSLPSFPTPMQKLQLFSDACAEVAECAVRHHRREPMRPTSPALKRPSLRRELSVPLGRARRSLRRSASRENGMHHVPSWQCALDIGAAEAAAEAAVEAATRASRGMPQAASWHRVLDQMAPEENPEPSLNEHSAEASLGADELIPLMVYVLIRARLPSLVSELNFVRSFFINEDALLGQHGYALATFEAAMALLTSNEIMPQILKTPRSEWTEELACEGDEARSRGDAAPHSPPIGRGSSHMKLLQQRSASALQVVLESPGSSSFSSSCGIADACLQAQFLDAAGPLSSRAEEEERVRAEQQAHLIDEARATALQVQLAAEELESAKRRVEELSARSNFPGVPAAPGAQPQLYLKQMLSQINCAF